MTQQLDSIATVTGDDDFEAETLKNRASEFLIDEVVLMDCQMPVMDGYAATAEIRRLHRDRHHRIPIIALTANTMPGDEPKCLAAGMDAFLGKPFTTADLVTALAPWVTTKPAAVGIQRRA